MTRNDILSAGMLRSAHPQFGVLSYARWIMLDSIRQRMIDAGNDCGHTLTGIRWLICSRPPEDAEIVAALASSDPIAELSKIWQATLHVSDVPKFTEWWEAEISGQEAAATTHKPDTRLGKPEASEEQTQTT